MKPLWRWTIGEGVSELGWQTLSESVFHAPRAYPEFDFVICHNGLCVEDVARLERFNIPLFEQQEDMSCIKHDRNREYGDYAWKIIPVRMRLEAHELWVDNDIVIRDRISDVDRWLKGHTGLISKGFKSEYGRFKSVIRHDVDCCAGLFGLPPYFDFGEHIQKVCGNQPLVGFDEQGLVAYVVSNLPNWIEVSYDHFRMWGHWQKEFDGDLPEGIHFVGVNRYTLEEATDAWRYYKMVTMP